MTARPGIDRRSLGKVCAAGVAGMMLPGARGEMAGEAPAGTVEWRVEPVGIDTLRPRFRWTVGTGGQRGFRLSIVDRAGRLVFDSGWRTGAAAAFTPAAALTLASHTAYRWRVAIEDAAGGRGAPVVTGRFVTGIMTPADWAGRWIAMTPDGPPSRQPQEWEPAIDGAPTRLPLLRGGFDEHRRAVAAYLSIAGLGHYALSINGVPIGDGDLRSGWTDYRRTVLYDTFDVTDLIVPGQTVIAAMLGNGFYNVERAAGRYTKLAGSFGQPKLILQLTLVFADGSERIVCSGADWLAAAGPIVFSSIYGGEDYDARQWPAGWDRGARAPAGFGPVQIVGGPGGVLRANGLPPVSRVASHDRPRLLATRAGAMIFDFGSNFAGRPAIVVAGATAGQTVTMKPGELLLPDGTGIDQQSMTGHKPGYNGIAFSYVADGPARQAWRPRFTYTGFRYLQVEGAAPAQLASLSGEVMRLDTPEVGRFDCSDKQLVAIHRLIDQAVSSNLMSVVTDCPQREKLGWLEQFYLNAPTIMYNRDAAALYEKTARDMREAQLGDGTVPSIAPEYIAFVDRAGHGTDFRDSPEWGSAIVLAPWAAYRHYGDRRILEENWAAMRAYERHLADRARGEIVDFGLGDWYDIGPAPPGPAQLTTRAFTGTATRYAVMTAMAGIANVLRRHDEARDFSIGAAAVGAAINGRFLDRATGRYDRGSQAAQAMALALGIVPAPLRPGALKLLIDDIAARGDHVSAGDVGFHYVVRALADARRPDVMYRLLSRTDAPSYGAQLRGGATALTEAWDAGRSSSQNHFMLGHAEAWLYGGLGGIGIDFTDPVPISIAPQPVQGIDWVDVSHRSVLGTVNARWERRGTRVILDIEIPAGATARVTPPGSAPVMLGGGRHRV